MCGCKQYDGIYYQKEKAQGQNGYGQGQDYEDGLDQEIQDTEHQGDYNGSGTGVHIDTGQGVGQNDDRQGIERKSYNEFHSNGDGFIYGHRLAVP